ncbi:hypothetical protein OG978_45655 (plasmid) [Streptomyces sp. NBC_01591]|uniref:hypothetical protein n=1 Tax=Streptomyces sp. NBC_01591 TaxID=2975888 RepID=UPI002DDBCF46|nr:hypothetical protein [Streptomyces sp. NBC_01591]WSD74349.1 hypothetical protein OG978_45655 [Streptomyces sp. NBC_01591]
MSLRLYLNSARQPRTPNGSAGEWADFFDGAMELEAKNWPPLLWWAMFSPGDLAEARIADTEDAGTDEHAELLSEWGEATYPYLVVDQPTALSRLHARRQGLTSRLGAQFSPLYDEFVALIDARFGPYVLLRTEALADGGEGGVRLLLEETLADVERLDAGHSTAAGGRVDSLISDFQRWQHTDPVWLLSGIGDGWPSVTLRERYAATAVRRPSSPSAEQSTAVGWVWGFLVVVCSIGAYWLTGSAWPIVVAFGVILAVLVAGFVRRRG